VFERHDWTADAHVTQYLEIVRSAQAAVPAVPPATVA
jgi:hypothetical protein